MQKQENGALSVRPATQAESERIAAFQIAMARETEDLELDPDCVARGVRAVFEDPSRGRYLVAVNSEGELLGSLLLTTEWSDWRNQTFWWIQSVFVLGAARGRGVFRALYEYVVTSARQEPDVCGVRLYVDQDNRRAQEVYCRLGMSASHYQFFELDFQGGK